jgi:hypothetical protein
MARGADNSEVPDYGLWIDGSLMNDLPAAALSELFNVNFFIVSQVNPHVLPFLFKNDTLEGSDGYFSNDMIQVLLRYLGREVWTICGGLLQIWMRLLARFHALLANQFALPHFNFSILNVIEVAKNLARQNYSGNITLVPPMSANDLLQLMTNPSHERVRRRAAVARRYTWQQMERLSCSLEVEYALDRHVRRLRGEKTFLARTQRLRRLGRRRRRRRSNLDDLNRSLPHSHRMFGGNSNAFDTDGDDDGDSGDDVEENGNIPLRRASKRRASLGDAATNQGGSGGGARTQHAAQFIYASQSDLDFGSDSGDEAATARGGGGGGGGVKACGYTMHGDFHSPLSERSDSDSSSIHRDSSTHRTLDRVESWSSLSRRPV